MKLSIIIPTVNQTGMLFECIDSFKRFHEGHEVIVVDDGSGEPIQAAIAQWCRDKGVNLVLSKENKGFSNTVNKGMSIASGDVLVLCNNDVVFTQAVDKDIENAFGVSDKIAVVGGLLYYPNGTIQHGGIFWTGQSFSHRGWHKRPDQAQEVMRSCYLVGVTGALMAIRKDYYQKVGGLNENYFLSCEDTEYCLKAWKSGYRVYYSAKVQAIHAEGATRGRTDQEKIIKHREWYRKELETWSKFKADVNKEYNLAKIHESVAAANCEGVGADMIEVGSQKGGKVAVVRRLGALGDVLLSTGVVRRLKRELPDHKIVVHTHSTEVFKGSPHAAAAKDITGLQYDKLVDLDLAYENNPKVPVWEAYSRVAFGDAGTDPTPDLFSGDEDAHTLKAKLGGFASERPIVIHAAVSWANRTWARKHWMEVIRGLSGHKVIVIGRGGDYRSDLLPGVMNLVDFLSIHEVRELCKMAKAFVGMDSGMLHVAQTTDVPIIGLFTVADPKNRMIVRNARSLALVPKMDCRFCLHRQKPPVTFVSCEYGTNHCLESITPAHVLAAVQEVVR